MISLWRHLVRLSLLLAAPALIWSQTASDPPIASSAPAIGTALRAQMPEPAVPADPLELVTGNAEPVQTVSQRAAVIKLLSDALMLSNVRAFPYYRKTAFVSFGSTSSEGNWELEDTSPGARVYRWAAQGPSYSVVNLYKDELLYSNQPAGEMPLRLAQVRGAIFFVRPMVGPRATLRIASGSLNRAALECVLLSHMRAAKGVTGGRRWEEAEYCIDTASGALITYSPAPGLYTLYDYSQAIHFHDRLIPNQFTITQLGRTVIEAKTIDVSDPGKDSTLFNPAGLSELGVGSLMTAAWNFHSVVASAASALDTSQVVVFHGMQSASGKITDMELLASSNSAMNGQALEIVSRMQGRADADAEEPGATLQSHEVLLTIQFAGTGR